MRKFFRKPPQKPKILLNELVPFNNFLVIDQNNKSLGILSKTESLIIAEKAKLDLFCINSNPQKPVCKILNYDNYRFNQQKIAKKYKTNNNEAEVKEVRISPSIGDNDLKVKINQCQKFLEKKYRVKVTMRLRGREKYVPNYGLNKIQQLLQVVSNDNVIFEEPKLKNNSYTTFLELKK